MRRCRSAPGFRRLHRAALALCAAGLGFLWPLAAADLPPAADPAPAPAPDPATPPPAANPGTLPPPAIRPFERPQTAQANAAARAGSVTLSDGKTLPGALALTEGKTLRLLDIASKKYRDITFDQLRRLDVTVEFEKKQEEWTFKEGGNDEKIYSGNFYIDRRYQVKATFLDGTTAQGYVLGTVFYLTGADGKKQRFFLHKDERGENKQEPKDIVYVVAVVFDPPAAAATPPAAAPAADTKSATGNPPPAPATQRPATETPAQP